MRSAIWLSGILASLALATPALAIDQVNREQDIVDVRLGQRILGR